MSNPLLGLLLASMLASAARREPTVEELAADGQVVLGTIAKLSGLLPKEDLRFRHYQLASSQLSEALNRAVKSGDPRPGRDPVAELTAALTHSVGLVAYLVDPSQGDVLSGEEKMVHVRWVRRVIAEVERKEAASRAKASEEASSDPSVSVFSVGPGGIEDLGSGSLAEALARALAR